MLVIAFVIMCSQNGLFSQNNYSNSSKSGLFFGISLEPSQSLISNKGASPIPGLLYNKMNSFFGSADIGYYFSKNIGVSSGIGIISYNTNITLPSYESRWLRIDSEQIEYEQRVSGSKINEKQNVVCLSIPINLNLRLLLGNIIGFFVQPGISINVPLTQRFENSGIFSYKGYYSIYNILLEDLPGYGFPSNLKNYTYGDLELSPFFINATASVGFDFNIQKNAQFAIAATYCKSLTNISAYSLPDKFQVSTEPNQINSLMGASSNISAQSIGITFILRYYFKISE